MEGEMRDREQMRELDVREYLSSVLPQLADLADTVGDEDLQMLAVQLRLAADSVKPSRQSGFELH
jgi:hypothetical protein